MMYMTISKVRRGSWGIGYEINLNGFTRTYFGYSLKAAEKSFRTEYGLKGKRFFKVYLDLTK